jgi:hypothetical protein
MVRRPSESWSQWHILLRLIKYYTKFIGATQNSSTPFYGKKAKWELINGTKYVRYMLRIWGFNIPIVLDCELSVKKNKNLISFLNLSYFSCLVLSIFFIIPLCIDLKHVQIINHTVLFFLSFLPLLPFISLGKLHLLASTCISQCPTLCD